MKGCVLMSRTVNITDEIIVVSHGEEDTGKMAMLGANGKFHPSVIPEMTSAKQPRCRAFMKTATTAAKGIWTPLGLQTVEYDTDSICTSDPTKFKINTSGLYLIMQQSNLTTGTSSSFYVGIRKNGNGDPAAQGYGVDVASVSSVVYLNANDYIEPMAIQWFSETTLIPGAYITITKIGD